MTAKFSKIADDATLFAKQLADAAQALNLAVSELQIQQLLRYLDGLLLWGKAYNLTAILQPQEALVKHIFDCMAIVPDLPFADKSGVHLLDIGTGAGLPSVIVAILRPDWQVDALDSNSKKVRFIRQIASELGLTNITPIASRIEQHHENQPHAYDVITSRAFASLTDFVDLAAPCLKADGVLYAMKGKQPSKDELSALDDWQICVQPIAVPKLPDDRCVVYLHK